MENASKALLIAATALVGVLLISLGVYLFTVFGDFSAGMSKKLTEKNISEFNAQFLKYESYQDENTGEWRNTCRAQDVVTIANTAKEINNRYEYTIEDQDKGFYYVRVIVKQGSHTINNFEANSLEEYKEFLKQYSGEKINDKYVVTYFKCNNIVINPDSKRVCSVTFEQI